MGGRAGFKFTLNDYQSGEEAGLKSATFTVAGDYAYGLLSGETGSTAWCGSRRSTRPPPYLFRLGLRQPRDRRYDQN